MSTGPEGPRSTWPRRPFSAKPGPRSARPVRYKRQRRRLHPLVVAALVIVAAVAITYYAFDRNLPFQHRFTASAIFSNSVNVRSGDPVRIAGIDVGTVSGVSAAGDASKVSFTVSSIGLPVHRNATHPHPRPVVPGRQLLPGS